MKHIDKDIKLTNGSVLLRSYRLSDVDVVYEAVRESITELSVKMYWCHPDYSIEETRTWVESCAERWEKGTEYSFAVIDSGNGLFLGSFSLTIVHPEFELAEIGYYVRTSRTRRGIATAATKSLIQFGFNQLKLNRIEIIMMTDNLASQRVAEKAGATREGILRNRFFIHGKTHDAILFSLIPQDLTPKVLSVNRD